MVHNRYQHAGGEDAVFANEVRMLRNAGHDVIEHVSGNERIITLLDKVLAGLGATWSYAGYRAFGKALDVEKPDVVHIHNFFPYPSPSILWASARRRVPTVWTLHNFRLTCANGLLYRNNKPCTKCVGRNPFPAILHKCYRGSRVGSLVVATNIALHRFLRTWQKKVSQFIVLSEFSKKIFIDAGVPEHRIAVKPNFSEPSMPSTKVRSGALYVGRLSPEKGVEILVRAWKDIPETLTIVGDGPLRAHLENIAGPNVRFEGKKSKVAVNKAMMETRLLIVPSLCFENFPMTIVEGMSAATPILASRIGALSTIIEDGLTGIHFNPGDAEDLSRKAIAALANDSLLCEIGNRGHRYFKQHMGESNNAAALSKIYQEIMNDGVC